MTDKITMTAATATMLLPWKEILIVGVHVVFLIACISHIAKNLKEIRLTKMKIKEQEAKIKEKQT